MRQFGPGLAELWNQDIGVVTEAALATWCIDDFTMPLAFRDEGLRIIGMAHQHQYGDIVGAAIGDAGKVGNQFGVFAYHLHFDISTTDQLDKAPTYWPGLDMQSCNHHFVNVRDWLRDNLNTAAEILPEGSTASDVVSVNNEPTTGGQKPNDVKPLPAWYVINPKGAQVYKAPSITAEKSALLPRGTKVTVDVQKGRKDATLIWGPIVGGDLNGQWVAIRKNDGKESYLSTNPPK